MVTGIGKFSSNTPGGESVKKPKPSFVEKQGRRISISYTKDVNGIKDIHKFIKNIFHNIEAFFEQLRGKGEEHVITKLTSKLKDVKDYLDFPNSNKLLTPSDQITFLSEDAKLLAEMKAVCELFPKTGRNPERTTIINGIVENIEAAQKAIEEMKKRSTDQNQSPDKGEKTFSYPPLTVQPSSIEKIVGEETVEETLSEEPVGQVPFKKTEEETSSGETVREVPLKKPAEEILTEKPVEEVSVQTRQEKNIEELNQDLIALFNIVKEESSLKLPKSSSFFKKEPIEWEESVSNIQLNKDNLEEALKEAKTHLDKVDRFLLATRKAEKDEREPGSWDKISINEGHPALKAAYDKAREQYVETQWNIVSPSSEET